MRISHKNCEVPYEKEPETRKNFHPESQRENPFRYRFFFCISAILLAFMLILSTAAFVFRETIDLYLCGSRTNVSEEKKTAADDSRRLAEQIEAEGAVLLKMRIIHCHYLKDITG